MATGTRPIKASSPGPVLDYLQDAETTLGYYDEGAGFDKAWGSLGRELGLTNGITREQWVDAFYGRWDGVQQVRKTENRVPLQDVTLSTPKSVAELFVAADDELREQLTQAVWAAAEEAFNYLEKTTLAARVRSKVLVDGHTESEQRRYPARLLATPVMQFSARPTEETEGRGAPGDPHVHVHLPIFTWCRVDDRNYTADSWGFKVNAEHVDQVFMGELARQLEELGIGIECPEFDRARNGKVLWEVAGSRKATRDFWSSNRERMWGIRRAFEEEFGKPIDEIELRRRMHLTKKSKSAEDKVQDSRPNWDRWHDDAQQHGMKLLDVRRQEIRHDAFTEADRLRERLMGPQGFCRDDATFDEATIGQTIRRCAVGLGFDQRELDGLEHIFLSRQSKDIVVIRDAVDADNRLYTTQALIDAEDRVARWRDEMADRWVDLTGKAGTGKSSAVAAAVATLRTLQPQEREYEGKTVTVEPAPISEALKATLQRDDFTPNEGQRQAMDAILASGRKVDQVIVVSMAAATAERTGLKVKADAWGSVESITSRIDRGQLQVTTDSLFIIEEVGQLDTLRVDRLLEAVGSARIVTLGDSKQLGAIGAAGWYADALDRHGSVELTEVRRQADQRDVEAYDLVRHGQAVKALQDLDERGRVHFAETDADRMAQVFGHYRQLRDEGTPARRVRIVMDSSNVEVDTGNRFVQRDRLERGEIGQQAVTVEQGERRWELHDNDQVIMLEAVRVQGQAPIKNGTTGVIMRVDEQQCRIRLEDGSERTIPTNGSIGLAYTVHIQKYQGGETEFALVAPGRGQTSANSAYTMLTRGVVESHVFASEESHGSIERLGEMWQRDDGKESVTRTMARLQSAATQELPPVQQDELLLEDVDLEPMPDLDPVEIDDFEPMPPEPRRIERRRLEPRTLEPRVIEPPGISGMEMSGPE